MKPTSNTSSSSTGHVRCGSCLLFRSLRRHSGDYKKNGGSRRSSQQSRQKKNILSLQEEHNHSNKPIFLPSHLVNIEKYYSCRIPEIDDDEALNWNAKLINVLNDPNPSIDIGSTLQTAIRRGVPDWLKRDVFIRAQGTDIFMGSSPTFYNEKLQHTFGLKIPEFFENRVPTFSGGFLGMEEDILGSPIDVEHLEVDLGFDINRSEVSWTDLRPLTLNPSNNFNQSLSPRQQISLHQSEKRSPLHHLESHDFDAGLNYRSYVEQPLSIRTLGKRLIGSRRSDSLNHILLPAREFFRRRSEYISKDNKEMTDLIPTVLHASSNMTQRSFKDDDSCSPYIDSDEEGHIPSYCTRDVSNDLKPIIDQDFSEFRIRFEPGVQDINDTLHLSRLTPPWRRKKKKKKDVYRLESITHLHQLLSEQGIIAAKRLLWCLSTSFQDVEFCPLIPNLICVCLLYMTETETFFLFTRLLSVARQTCQDGNPRPFITYRRTEYVRVVKLVMEIATKHLSKITNRLLLLKVDVAAWFAKMMSDGLARAVPFNTLLRIYTAFFFEGAKVFQRYCLALLKVHESRLMRCTSKAEAESILQGSKRGSVSEVNLLTKVAFRLSIKWSNESIGKYSSHDIPTPYLTGVKVQRFYRPRLRESSGIIKDAEWEYIWSWVPHKFRILDPSLSWKSDRDGMSFSGVNRKLNHLFDRPMVFLLSTEAEEVIGGYSDRTFNIDKEIMDATDPSDSFLFQLRPNRTAYWWTGANFLFIQYTSDFIMLGGNSVALSIDSDIHWGHSAPSESFDSPQLAGDDHGDFIIRSMEVWTLH